MNAEGRPLLPVACTLTDGGAAQLEAWRAFNNDYQLDVERTPGSITIHYAKVDDAVSRLRDMVRVERSCCAFASWLIDDTHPDLRLRVTATDEALSSLAFLNVEGRL